MTEVNFKWLTGENVKFNIGNERATAEPTGEEATKHRATENVYSEFPWRRSSLSIVGIWMCLTIHIITVQQNCCNGAATAWSPIRNNGYCECGALNATCGCTTFTESYYDGKTRSRVTTICGNGCCAYGECTPLFNATTHDLDLCASEDDEQIMLLSSPRAPDCNCCSSPNGLISLGCFVIFVVSWVLSLVFDLVNMSCQPTGDPVCPVCVKSNGPSLFRKLAALSKRSAGASGVETLTARTAFACSSTVKLVMHAECSHKEGKKRSKHSHTGGGGTHWVVTARVKQDYAVRVTHEACAPLAPTPAAAGGGWDVPWRDHAGRSHVTHSHRGLLEVRRGLKVSWEHGHDRAKFKAAFAAFRAANCSDAQQRYWTTLELVPAAPDLAFTWELRAGATPALLGPGYCLLASLLGLGWLYEVWYDSLSAVVEQHLHKTITVVGAVGDALATVVPGTFLGGEGGGLEMTSVVAASAPPRPRPPLVEMVAVLKEQLGIDAGATMLDAVDSACAVLGLKETNALSVAAKAERCYDVLHGTGDDRGALPLAPAGRRTMEIALPQGVADGHVMQMQTPTGEVVSVTAPPGATAGQVIQIEY